MTDQPIKSFRPTAGRVLVLRDGTPDKVGSILVPEVAKEANRPFECTVVAVGPGDWGTEGLKPMWVKPGDRVLINRYLGPSVEIEGVEHLIIEHTDVQGIIE